MSVLARLHEIEAHGGGPALVFAASRLDIDLLASLYEALRGIGRAGRQAQLVQTGGAGPDHPLLPQLAETGYLKALVFRV